ncbi:MAG: MqnA/MqnD/SBP family protein [Campylobacterales bacterium]
MVKKYRVAHSPDADDLFMFAPVRWGWVSVGGGRVKLEGVTVDIEELNRLALEGVYDVTAISFGVYPLIWREYALLRSCHSFGFGYGPKLVKRKGSRLRRRFRVALSGEYTTNALIFKIAYPEARPVYTHFRQIEELVLKGEVEAGVLIHESILDLPEGLEVERELWDIWVELVREELPLPLGGMALRRSIPLLTAIEIEEGLQRGVELGNRYREIGRKMLEESFQLPISGELLERYLEMYAGEEATQLSEAQIRGLEALFKLATNRLGYPRLGPVESYTIPRGYRTLREGRVQW